MNKAMNKINDGGPAFGHGDHQHGGSAGMSLRDWFAGQALDAIIRAVCAGQHFPHSYHGECPESAMARNAYRIADAMLKAREAAE